MSSIAAFVTPDNDAPASAFTEPSRPTTPAAEYDVRIVRRRTPDEPGDVVVTALINEPEHLRARARADRDGRGLDRAHRRRSAVSTMLTKGQRFQMAGQRWRVVYVNASRAHCVATVREPVTVRTRYGPPHTFEATRRLTIDISPNSAVDLFSELERE
jgi:hypothetical protein